MSLPRARPGPITIAAVVGLILGASRPQWQDAVEPSQVWAGLVTYTDEANPFYLYQRRAATLLHVLGAAALRAGLDEATLSVLLSALMGARSFAAIAAWMLALTGRAAPALAAPPLLVLIDLADWGLRYPLLLLDTPFTYGAMGLAGVMLALGLVACGHVAAGAFLAGLAPAIHLVWGAWGLLVLAVAFAMGREWAKAVPSRAEVRRVGGALASGLVFAGVFLAPYLAQAVARGGQTASPITRAYLAQIRADDALGGFHQGPLDPAWPQVIFLLCALALSAAILAAREHSLAPSVRRIAWLHVVATVLGFAVAIVHTALADRSPAGLVMSIPCRFLNLAVLASLLVLLGSLYSRRGWAPARVLLCLVIATAVALRVLDAPLAAFSSLRASSLAALLAVAMVAAWTPARGRVLAAACLPLGAVALNGLVAGVDPAIGVGALALITWLVLAAWTGRPSPLDAVGAPDGVMPAITLAAGLAAAVAIVARPRIEPFDPRHDAALAHAQRGSGTLLPACGLVHAQRLTRRPILLDTEQLDMLPYVLDAAPDVDQLLRRVYGRGLLDRPPASCRPSWEARTQAEWTQLAAALGTTEVLTFSDWRLDLPEIARGESYALYRAAPR